MPETEPSFAPVLSKEHQELAKLEAQLAQKQMEVDGKTAFGKFDGPMTPNEGEVTYDGYLAERPDKGIVRDGDVLRQNGAFASVEAYTAQNSTAQEHYDTVGEIDNKGEVYKAPEYESMHFMALVKEAGKAKLLGDRAELETIRAVAEHNLMEEATRPDSEWTDEEVADQLRRFDSLADVYVNRANGTAAPEATDVHTTSGPEGAAATSTPDAPVVAPVVEAAEPVVEAPVAEVSAAEVPTTTETPVPVPDAEPIVTTVPEAVATAAAPTAETVTPVTPEAPVVAEKRTETRRTGEVKFGGETVILGETFSSESGREIFEITGADGEAKYVTEDKLEYVTEEVEIEEKETLKEKLAKLWASEKVAKIKEKFTFAFWGPYYQDAANRFIEKGVDPEMSDAEKERQRKVNHGKLMLGFAAVPVSALGSALFAKSGDVEDNKEKVETA